MSKEPPNSMARQRARRERARLNMQISADENTYHLGKATVSRLFSDTGGVKVTKYRGNVQRNR
jgi:hypothetical protein